MLTPTDNFIFHDNTTVASSNGKELPLIKSILMNVEINATGTFKAYFEAKVATGKYYPWMAVKIPSLDVISDTTDGNFLYQVDLSGLTGFRVRLESVVGSVSVYGRVLE